MKNELYTNIISAGFGSVIKMMSDFFVEVQIRKNNIKIKKDIIAKEKSILQEFPDAKPEINYIKNHNSLSVFNYPFMEKYRNMKVKVFFDKESKLKYVLHNGKRLFYPASMRDRFIKNSYVSVCLEQDVESPHCYLDKNENLNDTILFDCGCAEANFSLNMVEQVKALYLFEGDNSWFRALHETFLPWKKKVKLVRRFLGLGESNTVSLRKYIEKIVDEGKLDYENDKVFIKMDIEGSEVEVINDILPLLFKFQHLRIAVCVYHRAEHERMIKSMLPSGYKVRTRNGYMVFVYESELPGEKKLEYPYFRHGVLRIER